MIYLSAEAIPFKQQLEKYSERILQTYLIAVKIHIFAV